MRNVLMAIVVAWLLAGCDNNTDDLWNDLKVGDDIYHFSQVEFRQDSLIVCVAEQGALVSWQLALDNGMPVTRKLLLQRPEGWHATARHVLMRLEGSKANDGTYRGVGGTVEVMRHEFKTAITMHELQLVCDNAPTDTIDINDGYLSFDLTFF